MKNWRAPRWAIDRRWPQLAIALVVASLWVASPARAQDAEGARALLKKMSDYVASQQDLSLTFDADIEVVTTDLQKIQFTSSGQVELSRPDKIRIVRAGSYSDVEMAFDGRMLILDGKGLNVFAQLEAPGSIDDIMDRLQTEIGITAPGADLLVSQPYDRLIEDVIDAKYVGQGVVDGVECEHLAFRNAEVD